MQPEMLNMSLIYFSLVAAISILYLLNRVRRIELEIAQKQETFRHMTMAAEQSPNAILYVNSEGTVVYVNKQFLNLLRCTDNIVGKNIFFDNDIDVFIPKSIRSNVRNVIKKREPWNGLLISDITASNDPVFGSATPIFNATDDIDHILVMSEDNTATRVSSAQKLFQEANYSSVTLLPNRKLAFEELNSFINHSNRTDTRFALIVLDIDHFKDINDIFGLPLGDQILMRFGKRLAAIEDLECFIAHIGGDKFALISAEGNYNNLISHAKSALEKPYKVDDKKLSLSACFGITFYPGDGQDCFALLRNAEAAMYQAKSIGRNQVHYFQKELNQRSVVQFNTANQLSQAIENEELSIFFQPVIDLNNNQVAACEVLLRWDNKVLGSVPPSQFIPIAEDTGLIIPIGHWVLEQACISAAKWKGEQGKVNIAVNVSSRQFNDGVILDSLKHALDISGLNPNRLTLEITEGLLLDDQPETLALLMEIKNQGVQLALDDFGTGYSSLSYLKRYPFNTLKIDRSFIKDITDVNESSALTLAMIAMAHSLGLKVVAEGVETPDQQRLLAEKDCDLVQGFLYSKPLAEQDFTTWLARYIKASEANQNKLKLISGFV